MLTRLYIRIRYGRSALDNLDILRHSDHDKVRRCAIYELFTNKRVDSRFIIQYMIPLLTQYEYDRYVAK